jgi:N utilization substance protein A
MKGSRVQSIIRELRGEKIDIIEWSEDPAIFAANALSPAKVSKVTVLDFEDKKLQVIVENEQQSLAIGKRGQNVRLAAKLVGWDIDIRSEEEMKREVASQMEQMISAPVVKLSSIEGISVADSDTLAEHDIETIEQLAEANVDDLCDWLDISVDEAEDLLDMARAITDARRAHANQFGAEPDETEEEEEGLSEEEAEEGAGEEIEDAAEAEEAVADDQKQEETAEAEETDQTSDQSDEANTAEADEASAENAENQDQDEKR